MDPLLRTKLYVPELRPDLVPRPELVSRLNEGLHRKLSLVSAPAGSGKTTLVAEWLSQTRRPRTWISLDVGDNDPARFLAYLVAALGLIHASVGTGLRAMSQSPTPPEPEAMVSSLINEIAEASVSFVLVLDDYHLIHSLAIHQMVAFLLEHMPPSMHIVIATREDPPTPLGRLRGQGQVTDIRQADLRFTEQETAHFLRTLSRVDLLPDEISEVHRRTEGWAAGLQLAGLSLRGTDDAKRIVQSFTGSSRFVLDFLIEEVFQQQSTDTRSFLLQTSILDRLTAPLCDAVTGRSDSHEMLVSLERANLFTLQGDSSREWYRYHRLFADLLRHRLSLDEGCDEQELHRRASRWYAQEGLPSEAVNHALAASAWAEAAQLILDASDMLLSQGRMRTLLAWHDALPDDVVRNDVRLCAERAWPLILTEQLEEAERYLALAEQLAKEQDDGSLLGDFAAAHSYIARMRGDMHTAMTLSEKALQLLSRDDLVARSVVAVNLGISKWFQGSMEEAEDALKEAVRAGKGSGNDYAHCAARVFIARILRARGQLHESARACRLIVGEDAQASICCLAHYDLARILYEWDDLAGAAEHIEHGIELCRRGGSVEFLVGGLGTLAILRQAQGDATAAEMALQEAEELVDEVGISPATRLGHLVSRVHVSLAQGDLMAASQAATRAPALEESGSLPDFLALLLIRARLSVALGLSGAAEHLGRARMLASQTGWQSVDIQAHVLQSLVAASPDEALDVLADALARAEPEGYVRTFVDAGPLMHGMLGQATTQRISPTYIKHLRARFARDTGRGAERTRSLRTPAIHGDSPLIEPLSEREIQILSVLGEGLTNDEIARQLYISVNTVKTHLKTIYGKLGVHRRRDAVSKAHDLGLVD